MQPLLDMRPALRAGLSGGSSLGQRPATLFIQTSPGVYDFSCEGAPRTNGSMWGNPLLAELPDGLDACESLKGNHHPLDHREILANESLGDIPLPTGPLNLSLKFIFSGGKKKRFTTPIH